MIQVMSAIQMYDQEEGSEAYANIHSLIRRGDVVGVRGHPGKSKTGQLSIFRNTAERSSSCWRASARVSARCHSAWPR